MFQGNQKYQQYKQLIQLIDQGMLSQAIEQLKGNCSTPSSQSILDELNKISDVYEALINYYEIGAQDPSRKDYLRKCRFQLLNFATRLYFPLMAENNAKDDVFLTFNKLNSTSHSMSLLETLEVIKHQRDIIQLEVTSQRKEYDDALDTLFERIWTTPALDSAEYKALFQFFNEEKTTEYEQLIIVHAILNTLYAIFDVDYFKFLCESLPQVSTLVRYRIITVLTLVINKSYPIKQLQKRCLDLYESTLQEYADEFKLIHKQLLFNLANEDIQERIQKEILQNLQKDITKNMMSEDEELRENPQWGLSKRTENDLQALTELAITGADVYQSTFEPIMQISVHNINRMALFMPYDINHSRYSYLEIQDKTRKLIDLITASKMICDTDKNVLTNLFCFDHNSPFSKSIFDKMQAENEEYYSMIKEDKQNPGDMVKVDNINFIHDLNRFNGLIKSNKIKARMIQYGTFNASGLLPAFMIDDSTIKATINYMVEAKAYQQTILFYEATKFLNQLPDNAIAQRVAYAYIMTKDLAKAYHLLELILIEDPHDVWSLKKMVYVISRYKRKESEASKYYDMLDKEIGKTLKVSLLRAALLIENKEYDKAKDTYLEAYVFFDENVEVIRGLAWLYLREEQFDDAERYLLMALKIENRKHPWREYLNYGHLCFLRDHNLKKAMHEYQALKKYPDEKQKWFNEIVADTELFREKGLSDEDLLLYLEVLRKQLQ